MLATFSFHYISFLIRLDNKVNRLSEEHLISTLQLILQQNGEFATLQIHEQQTTWS